MAVAQPREFVRWADERVVHLCQGAAILPRPAETEFRHSLAGGVSLACVASHRAYPAIAPLEARSRSPSNHSLGTVTVGNVSQASALSRTIRLVRRAGRPANSQSLLSPSHGNPL